jgi:GNAT superfamily N-acetyltransferase
MKPFSVLSTGERFRVEIARHLLEDADPIVVDEFTSVIDRQVAKIGAHAVQKYIRKHKRRFVGVTCHYDVIDWLQPDWMLEPASMTFQWRSLQRRPALTIEIARVDYAAWDAFAPFHYLTNRLHKGAHCFVLFVDGIPASFAGVLYRPHAMTGDVRGISRLVTLPDYQGMGLAMVLCDTLGMAYKAIGCRLHMYPAHPALTRVFDHSPRWALRKKPGTFSVMLGKTSGVRTGKTGEFGGRPCAVFEYAGEPMADKGEAREFLSDTIKIREFLDTLLGDGVWRSYEAIAGTLRRKGLLFSDTLMRGLLQLGTEQKQFERSTNVDGLLQWRMTKTEMKTTTNALEDETEQAGKEAYSGFALTS